jgi:PAS domain S-box-containing protein
MATGFTHQPYSTTQQCSVGLNPGRIIYYSLIAFCLALIGWQFTIYQLVSRDRDRELAENQLWLETINRVPVALIIVDADTVRIVGFSEGAQHMFGWTPKEILGTTVFDLMPKEYAAEHVCRLNSPTVRDRLATETLKITCRMLRKDSVEPIMCSVTIRGVPTADRYRFLLTIERSDSIQEVPYRPRQLSLPKTPAQPQQNRKPYADLLPPLKNIHTPTLRN